jgi:hypothetical protein
MEIGSGYEGNFSFVIVVRRTNYYLRAAQGAALISNARFSGAASPIEKSHIARVLINLFKRAN